MYIKKVVIENIKSIDHLEIDFRPPYSGWHVLLGDNGAGKSTILKSISLCMLGERQGYSLNQDFRNWITKGQSESNCKIEILLDEEQDALASKYGTDVTYNIKIDQEGNLIFQFGSKGKKKRIFPINPSHGWYNAGFGPFRRLGPKETKNITFSDGNIENHITLFNSSYSLTGAVQWLMELKFEQLNTKSSGGLFEKVTWFLNNSNLLPENVVIDQVDHQGVYFTDGNNSEIDINELSDGYQSIFSLAIEILRQMSKRFEISAIIKKLDDVYVLDATGVIMIDEIDIHLHPEWQSKIGDWFKRNFPKIQFIVSTHSPIICQSADQGSIWKIEHQKSDKDSREVTGQDFKRMVFGSIIDAMGTDNFGDQNVERSEKSKKMLERLAYLNIKSVKGKATDEEKSELEDLRAILPSE